MSVDCRDWIHFVRRTFAAAALLLPLVAAGCGGDDATETPSNPAAADRGDGSQNSDGAASSDGIGDVIGGPADEHPASPENNGPPKITGIYPSGNIVPANLRNLHIQFSQPMRQDGLFNHLRLIDQATGEPISQPFADTVMWSKDSRQLTLRLRSPDKNGNEENATILEVDGRYELQISGDWESSSESSLGEPTTRVFRVGPSDRLQPDTASWILSNPQAGSDGFLSCDFHEPLDWALLNGELSVRDAGGKEVAGRIEMGYGELSWTFYPDKPWKRGKYRLAVGAQLADLAGNSIERLYKSSVSEGKTKPKGKTVYLDFEVFGKAESPP